MCGYVCVHPVCVPCIGVHPQSGGLRAGTLWLGAGTWPAPPAPQCKQDRRPWSHEEKPKVLKLETKGTHHLHFWERTSEDGSWKSDNRTKPGENSEDGVWSSSPQQQNSSSASLKNQHNRSQRINRWKQKGMKQTDKTEKPVHTNDTQQLSLE